MNPQSSTTIYAMVGPMGSGKSTYALKLAKEQNAKFFSLDKTIKDFNEPIDGLKGYELHMKKALVILSEKAIKCLKAGQSVVFDFGGGIGHWDWLKHMADEADTKIEIYHFEILANVRWARVQKRNLEKPEGIYHFNMSKEEFDRQSAYRVLPALMPGLKIFKITK